jgi:hypothetical protein
MKDMEDNPVGIFRIGVQSRYGQVERQGDRDGQSETWESLLCANRAVMDTAEN